MGFTESLLSTGERVVHTEKQHWFVFVWGARLTIAAIILAIVFYILGGNLPQDGAGGAFRTILGWATLVLFIGGLANLAWTILSYMKSTRSGSRRRCSTRSTSSRSTWSAKAGSPVRRSDPDPHPRDRLRPLSPP
jgi:hypothetical protein